MSGIGIACAAPLALMHERFLPSVAKSVTTIELRLVIRTNDRDLLPRAAMPQAAEFRYGVRQE